MRTSENEANREIHSIDNVNAQTNITVRGNIWTGDNVTVKQPALDCSLYGGYLALEDNEIHGYSRGGITIRAYGTAKIFVRSVRWDRFSTM